MSTTEQRAELDLIEAALDDFHPLTLLDIANDLEMTTGAEGHRDAILEFLTTLPVAQAAMHLRRMRVERLRRG